MRGYGPGIMLCPTREMPGGYAGYSVLPGMSRVGSAAAAGERRARSAQRGDAVYASSSSNSRSSASSSTSSSTSSSIRSSHPWPTTQYSPQYPRAQHAHQDLKRFKDKTRATREKMATCSIHSGCVSGVHPHTPAASTAVKCSVGPATPLAVSEPPLQAADLVHVERVQHQRDRDARGEHRPDRHH